MNVLQNLTELYNQLPFDSTYRKVCSGILQNLKECADGTIYDMAELTNSSRTTIWRMVQKMGYASFSEFHFDLKKAVNQYSFYNRILPEKAQSKEQGPKEQMLSQLQQAADFLKDELEIDELEEMAEILDGCDKVSIYIPYQDCGAYSLQQNLSMRKKATSYFCLLPDIIADADTLTENSVVFIQTLEYAEAQDMTVAFQKLKESGAKVYMVASGESKYRKYIHRIIFEMKQKNNVAAGIIIVNSYFTILSEYYRQKYIDG